MRDKPLMPGTLLAVVVKIVWIVAYIGIKTNESVPSAKGIAQAGLIGMISMLCTSLIVLLLCWLDLTGNGDATASWFSFAGFTVVSLWTSHYVMLCLFTAPPIADMFNNYLTENIPKLFEPKVIVVPASPDHSPHCSFTDSKKKGFMQMQSEVADIKKTVDTYSKLKTAKVT